MLDAECALDEICQGGQCLNPCDQPHTCGLNAQCLVTNHVKQCVCSPSFTGDPQKECVRSKISNIVLSSIKYYNHFIFLLF